MKIMAESGSPVLITVTDAVVSASDTNALTSMLDVLHLHDISCSFLQTSQAESHLSLSFGCISNPEMLDFISSATGGASLYAADLLRRKENKCNVNASQWAFLCSTISCSHHDAPLACSPSADSYVVDQYLTSDPSAMLKMSSQCATRGDGVSTANIRPKYLNMNLVDNDQTPFRDEDVNPDLQHLSTHHNWQYSVPLMRRKWRQYSLQLPILVALGHRLREGWRIKSLRKPRPTRNHGHQNQSAVVHGPKCLEIILRRPFNEQVSLETVLFAPSPWDQGGLESGISETHVQIDIVAPYEIHRLFHGFHFGTTTAKESAQIASIKPLIRYLRRTIRMDQTLVSLFTLNEDYSILQKPVYASLRKSIPW